MLRLLHLISCCTLFIFLQSCRSYKPGDPLSATKSKKAILEDFDVFQNAIESAHPSLTSYVPQKRIDYLFDSVRSSISGSLSTRELYNKLFFLTNQIGCSHTLISLPSYIYDTLYRRDLFFPLPVTLIGDRLLVNSDHSLPHGTEIISISGTPSRFILNDLALYNPVDGHFREAQRIAASSDFGLQYFMKYGGAETFQITIKDTLGSVSDTTLEAIPLEDLRDREANKYYYDAMDVPYSLHIEEEKNYALIRLTTFDFESSNSQAAFEDFLKNTFDLLQQKPKCKNLIVDLRENGGGYLYGCFLFFSYLASSPFEEYRDVSVRIRKVPAEYLSPGHSAGSVDEINERLASDFKRVAPGKYKYEDSLISSWEPQKNRFLRNVFVITNSKVMSSATYFSTLVQNSGRGKIVGVENVGGEYAGNGFESLEYRLPNSELLLVFPYARIFYSYGTKKTGRGLIPDYIVPDNDSAFMKNKDKQLIFITDSLINK